MDIELKSFIKALYARCISGSLIEFRPITKNGTPIRRVYLQIDDYREIRKHCRLNQNSNCFYGIATRDGKGGTKNNIVQIPALWCDVDFKDINRKKLRKKLNKFNFPPSITVLSGGGYHLYWVLEKPAGKTHIPVLENLNRRIAIALNGDQNACDAARILRLPLTLNHKYRPPKKVSVKKIKPYEYELRDFAVLPKVEMINPKGAPHLNHSNWLIEAMQGVGKGERNATATRIAGYFLRKLNKKDLLIIMRMWNCNNEPPLKINELNGIVNSILRYKRSTSNEFQNNKTKNKKIRLSIK